MRPHTETRSRTLTGSAIEVTVVICELLFKSENTFLQRRYIEQVAGPTGQGHAKNHRHHPAEDPSPVTVWIEDADHAAEGEEDSTRLTGQPHPNQEIEIASSFYFIVIPFALLQFLLLVDIGASDSHQASFRCAVNKIVLSLSGPLELRIHQDSSLFVFDQGLVVEGVVVDPTVEAHADPARGHVDRSPVKAP